MCNDLKKYSKSLFIYKKIMKERYKQPCVRAPARADILICSLMLEAFSKQRCIHGVTRRLTHLKTIKSRIKTYAVYCVLVRDR